jgi:hypothetical protein
MSSLRAVDPDMDWIFEVGLVVGFTPSFLLLTARIDTLISCNEILPFQLELFFRTIYKEHIRGKLNRAFGTIHPYPHRFIHCER